MKKIFSIFILFLIFSTLFTMNVFAMYTNELYDNIANEEIRNNLPDTSSLTSPNAFILLYNNKTNQYFYFRNYRTNYSGKFRINSNTDMLTFDNGTNNCQFRGYYYDSASSKWILYSDSEGKSIFDEISVFDYSYIIVINTNLLVDDKTFDINEIQYKTKHETIKHIEPHLRTHMRKHIRKYENHLTYFRVKAGDERRQPDQEIYYRFKERYKCI